MQPAAFISGVRPQIFTIDVLASDRMSELARTSNIFHEIEPSNGHLSASPTF
jgi:hypothetical protein